MSLTETEERSLLTNKSTPDVTDLMPGAVRHAVLAGEIPSIRTAKKVHRVGEPKAREIVRRLHADLPDLPVSAGAPEYDPFTEVGMPEAPSPKVRLRDRISAPRVSVGGSRAAALLVPLLLVNSAAIYGQSGWAYDNLGHLGHHWPIAVLFAAAVESIGILLAAEAHAALMAGDASARLRLGSYLVGLLVGTLNYAHFASAGYTPNPLALTFGLLSSISPWLWSIRSRSLNRDRLRELGQVDPRAVRFSLLRWALFPVRTGRAFRGAVWAGVVQPSEAVANADHAQAARAAEKAARAAAKPSNKEASDVAEAAPDREPVWPIGLHRLAEFASRSN